MAVLDGFYEAERAYFAAGGPGVADFADVARFLAPDVVLYSAPGLPYGGVWRGHEGMERFLAAMAGCWESVEFLDRTHVAEGDRVAVFLRVVFRARNGRELETTLLQMNTVRNGLVTEFRPYYWDPAAVADVVRDEASRVDPA
ncbi:nuclear transport factor 2 family protein [Streptoalloteichus hindustanus]|nr:nuclear transport factor 2 family protein [Streptoalloteichus hindustanus]